MPCLCFCLPLNYTFCPCLSFFNNNKLLLWLYKLWNTNDTTGDAPLTFPLSDERLPPRLHVQAQVFHHTVDAVVQGQAAGLRLDGLSADGTLVFLFAPLLDAVTAEAVSAVQDDCLYQCRSKSWSYSSQRNLKLWITGFFSHTAVVNCCIHVCFCTCCTPV